MMTLHKRLLDYVNINRHISARVFFSIFISVLIVSILITSAYAVNAFNEMSNVLIDNSQTVMDSIITQFESIAQTVAQTHVLLFSSNDVYSYINNAMDSMPSYDWFQAYQQAQTTLTLCGRSQINLIMGMMLYRSQTEYMQYGSFYAAPSPYALPQEQIGHLTFYNGYPYYITSAKRNRGGYAYIISQLYDESIDAICASLLPSNGVILLMDSQRTLLRQYDDNGADAAAISAALMADGGAQLPSWHLITAKAPLAQLDIVMAVPVPDTQAKLMHVLPWLFPILLFAFLIGVVLSYGLSRSLAHDFKTMRENIQRVEQQRYQEVVVLSSQNELGQLSRIFSRMALRISALINEAQDRERTQRILEIQMLRAQVSPHFLYNALNNVRQLAAMQGMDHIARITGSLINLLHAALDNEGALVSLSHELAYVEDYYDVCKYQYLNAISLDYRIADDVYDLLLPQMTLQPIVENAMIHGLSSRAAPGGIIRVSASRLKQSLVLSIVDNGQGMSKQQLEALLKQAHNKSRLRFSGIGLRNVNERIRLRFGDDYGLKISSRPGCYTRVDILLPCLEKEACHEADSIG